MFPTPFTNMAVSLSGGGYRATTFHLGALCYLDATQHKGHSLLEHVHIVSTISGGTLTGVMYALKMSQDEGFVGCYKKLYQLLKEDNLVDKALHKLNNPRKWTNKYKTRDIINSFSEVYDEVFYEKATFADLYSGKPSHLKEAIFGASEFTYGLQFRFQEEGRFGNFYLNIPKEVSDEIRLADAAAASSCFPGGFEPMIMPNDFSNGPDSALTKLWYSEERDYETTAIMDGGIIDNQGIEGVKLAEERHSKDGDPYIGTYIVSDVSSEMMQKYKVPVFKYSSVKNWITLNVINIIALGALTLILSLLLFANLSTLGIIIASSFLPLIIIWFVAFFVIRSKFESAISGMFGPDQTPELMKDFKVMLRTPLYIIFFFLKFRASSVIQMVSDIFLKRIRRLQLNSLYDSSEWNYRFKSNYIYSLEKKKDLPQSMKAVVTSANKMPTTLWFTKKQLENRQLDDLIACGQFTLCHNLIKYCDRLQSRKEMDSVWNQLKESEQQDIIELKKRMEADWEKFKNDPYWMVDAYNQKEVVKK